MNGTDVGRQDEDQGAEKKQEGSDERTGLGAETSKGRRVAVLNVSDVMRDPEQPRKHFEPNALADLAESIKTQGLIQPILVREVDGGVFDPDTGRMKRYMIVAGERRWRANGMAGLDTIEAIVARSNDPASAAAAALVENVQRADLNPLEIAKHLRRLQSEHGYTQEDMAKLIGKQSKGSVSKLLSLINLPNALHGYIESGQITVRHAEILLKLKPADAISYGIQAATEEWTVKVLEQKTEALRHPKQKPAVPPRRIDPNLTRLATLLTEHLGTQTAIKPDAKGKGGEITLRYYDNDTLEGLLQRVGMQIDQL